MSFDLTKEHAAMLRRLGGVFDSEVEDTIAECIKSTEMTAKIFFPETFTREFSAGHREIFRILDDESIKLFMIVAPRGFGKTSIIAKATLGRRILFNLSKYIVPIFINQESAVEKTEDLKTELTTNEWILKFFGSLEGSNWTKEIWETSNGVRVLPRGNQQPVRGRVWQNCRPDFVIMDDLETKVTVRNERRRHELMTWINSDVCNCIDRSLDNWRIGAIGTVLHEASMVSQLSDKKRYPDWESIRIELCDDKFRSLDKNFMSDAQVMALVESHRKRGMISEFYMEYRNLIIMGEDADFRASYFQYYDETEQALWGDPDIESMVLVDPAKTVNASSALTAIVGVSVNTKTNKIYVRDVVAGRMHPDDGIRNTFEMAKRLRARVIGVEVTGLNEFITNPYKQEMSRRNEFYEFVELHARGPKEDRVLGMLPFYRQKQVYHNRVTCGGLETQLLSFPRSEYWDIMDALCYFVIMLEVGERYFQPEGDEFEDPDEIEKEFDELLELDDDALEPVEGWRVI